MIYFCQCFVEGESKPETSILCENIISAKTWAQRHTRVVHALGGGMDIKYYVTIHSIELELPIDFNNLGKPLLEVHINDYY